MCLDPRWIRRFEIAQEMTHRPKQRNVVQRGQAGDAIENPQVIEEQSLVRRLYQYRKHRTLKAPQVLGSLRLEPHVQAVVCCTGCIVGTGMVQEVDRKR